jgi:cytochrome P450/NADPH-cytochrome P450 reductase
MLPPLRPRLYSISSSPLLRPDHCTLTYSVVDAPSLSGSGEFHGVTGSYLRNLLPGDQILCSVRSTNKYFRMPADPEKTPLMMFCAGSGIAPFRGFIQERSILIKEGSRKLAKALLFVGCRAPELDALYTDEMAEWMKIGAVDVRYAFSKETNKSEGCRYIQDRMLKDKQDVYDLWKADAKVLVCGSHVVAKEIGRVAKQLLAEDMKAKGKETTELELEAWMTKNKNERFVSDVFS